MLWLPPGVPRRGWRCFRRRGVPLWRKTDGGELRLNSTGLRLCSTISVVSSKHAAFPIRANSSHQLEPACSLQITLQLSRPAGSPASLPLDRVSRGLLRCSGPAPFCSHACCNVCPKHAPPPTTCIRCPCLFPSPACVHYLPRPFGMPLSAAPHPVLSLLTIVCWFLQPRDPSSLIENQLRRPTGQASPPCCLHAFAQ